MHLSTFFHSNPPYCMVRLASSWLLNTIDLQITNHKFNSKATMKKHSSQTSTGEHADRLSKVLLATDPKELEAAYDLWASRYDADLMQLSGFGANEVGIVASKVVLRHFPKFDNNCQDILDFGCGTGTAGRYWKEEHGLDTQHTVDGCDLSQGMLDEAAKRNCYRALIKSDFDNSNCEAAKYDIVHASGVFAPGQAPPAAFDEFLRLLKPGGHAIFTVRCGYYDSEEGEAHRKHLEELVETKQWELVAKTEEEYLPKEGVKAYAFAMKKL